MSLKKKYEVTIKAEVHAPKSMSRSVEKVVHGLAQEYIPGESAGDIEIVGCGVTEVVEHGPVSDNKRYHVVLKRVVNIVVDNVEAPNPRAALDEALRQYNDPGTGVECKGNHFQMNGVPIDDGDQFTAALVDEYDGDEDAYREELVFDADKSGLDFKKKPRR